MKVTIELTEDQIRQITSTQKKKSGDFTDIKTVEDAFAYLDMDYKEWLSEHEHLPVDVLAYMKLTFIAKAINGGKWMDYTDTKVYKYYPYFNASGSASGFSFYDFRYGSSLSSVGSRLTFETADMAKYAGNQFLDIYNQYIN